MLAAIRRGRFRSAAHLAKKPRGVAPGLKSLGRLMRGQERPPPIQRRSCALRSLSMRSRLIDRFKALAAAPAAWRCSPRSASLRRGLTAWRRPGAQAPAVVHVCQRVAVIVLDDEAGGVRLLNVPGRREAVAAPHRGASVHLSAGVEGGGVAS